MKRIISFVLSTMLVVLSLFALASCENLFPGDVITDDHFKNVNMPYVYAIYLDYVNEVGEEPLSYEQWFELIHGDEFKEGIIPEIRKNDTTDFWEISYNNGKGWNDLRFKTETEEQKDCKHTFAKWIVICEGNDYFGGIRYRNCKYCNYKDYQFKVIHSFDVQTVEPTCTEGGYTISICKDCDLKTETNLKNPLGHNYVDGVCTRCGSEEAAHKHSLFLTEQKKSTCSEAGYMLYTCACSFEYKIPLDLADHRPGNFDFDGLSCQENATIWGSCLDCGVRLSVVDPTYTVTFEDMENVARGSAEEGKTVQLTEFFSFHFGEDTSVEDCDVTFNDDFVSTKKIVLPSAVTAWDGYVIGGISFNTTHVTKITVWWQSETYSGQIHLLNETGEYVLLTGVESYMGQTHISVFDGFEPGTYHIGRRYTDGYVSIHKVEVTLSNHEDKDGDFVCDTEGCGEIIPPESGSALTIPEAKFIAYDKNHNYFTNGTYKLSGTIINISNNRLGSMTIQDEDGNTINIYTVKDYDGTMYGDISKENKPQVGDYVTIQGSIGMYQDVAEINIGYIVRESQGE